MKVLLINGSPRANGNTARALKEVADTLASEGVETEAARRRTRRISRRRTSAHTKKAHRT